MDTRMSVKVILNGTIDSKELYEEVKDTGANVTDMGQCTFVHVEADIRTDVLERVLAACRKYDVDCQVNAHRIKDE